MGSIREDLACRIDSQNANCLGHEKVSAIGHHGISEGDSATSVMALAKTVPAITPIERLRSTGSPLTRTRINRGR